MKTIKGNIVDLFDNGDWNLTVHGCNGQKVMGDGVALALRKRWPSIYEADLKYGYNSHNRLGRYSWAKVDKDKVVMNAYTQIFYGSDNKRYVSYDAIDDVFKKIRFDLLKTHDKDYYKILIPKIGSKRGGGNWQIIKTIIESHLGDFDITLVEYDE